MQSTLDFVDVLNISTQTLTVHSAGDETKTQQAQNAKTKKLRTNMLDLFSVTSRGCRLSRSSDMKHSQSEV